MDSDFMTYANGVGVEWSLWTVAPEVLGKDVLETAKRTARFLQTARPDLPHSARLDVVAQGAGMSNWHALRTLAQGLIDEFDPEKHWPRPKGAFERSQHLRPAYPMLARAQLDCPPTHQEANGMRIFAERLAWAAKIPVDMTLDIVATMNGADTWTMLNSRRPEDSPRPLYRFNLDNEAGDSGAFRWSSACWELVRQQDERYQHYSSRSEKEQDECRKWVVEITTRRPDFLEGLLAKADIVTPGHKHAKARGRVYADAIDRAEKLIPTDFKGQIRWSSVGNRFFHRLLYNYMIWNILYGSRKRAIGLARKQLRWNPDDNLGVRYFLPVLLAADGQLVAAEKSLRLVAEGHQADAHPYFIRSLVFEALGRLQDAARQLLHALFVFPALRDVIAPDSEDRWDEIPAQSLRYVTLDREALLDQYVALTPYVRHLETHFPSLLRSRNVREAELELSKVFVRDRTKWLSLVEATVDRLVPVTET